MFTTNSRVMVTSRKPAMLKTKKANGISQYPLRIVFLLTRTVVVTKKAERPARNRVSRSPKGNDAFARYDRPAAKHNTPITPCRLRPVVSFREACAVDSPKQER